MTLRPGSVVRHKNSDKLFLLLHKGDIARRHRDENWRMLNLESGRLVGEFGFLMNDELYEICSAAPEP